MIDQSTVQNVLLGALRPEDFHTLIARSQVVPLDKGVDLALPGSPILFAWFPLSGLISVIAMSVAGDEAEIGLVGFDGLASTGIITGNDRYSFRVLVQIAGSAIRIDAGEIRALIGSSPHFSRLMLAYVEAFSIQVGTSALAYARLQIEQRLARWLLMCADRVGNENIALTHDTLSIMLGVRRAGVTVALRSLADLGAIDVSRGHQVIIDRDRLLQLAGGGYGDPEVEAARLIAAAALPL